MPELLMRLRQMLARFLSTWKVGVLLPLVGVGFWLAIGLLNQQVLSYSPMTTTELQAAALHQVDLSLSLTIVSIDVEIDRSTQISEVSIRAIGSPLEEMEFKFPVTDFAAVEQAIAQELGLSTTEIHDLIRHRIND